MKTSLDGSHESLYPSKSYSVYGTLPSQAIKVQSDNPVDVHELKIIQV